MKTVTVRDLRNHGGDVLDLVGSGHNVRITRAGKAVAQLVPLPTRNVSPAELVERRRNLPRMSLAELRQDMDMVLDGSL